MLVKIKGRIKRNGHFFTIDNIGLVTATSEFGYLVREMIIDKPRQYSTNPFWVSKKICTVLEGEQ